MNLEIERILQKSDLLPHGLAKLELLEEAIRMLDMTGDNETAYQVRDYLIEVAVHSGFPLKALIAYTWQLNQYDSHPELYPADPLMWSYKWIIVKTSHFPEIPLSQILELTDDLGKRYKQNGYSDRTYYFLKHKVAIDLGNLEEAEHYFHLFNKEERDHMSDCKACEKDALINYYVSQGDNNLALQNALSILYGVLKCAEVPHMTLANLLIPMLIEKSETKANKIHEQGYRIVKNNRNFLVEIGKHLQYCTMTNLSKGIDILEQHLTLTLNHESPLMIMKFNMYAAQFLKKLISQGFTGCPHVPTSYWPNQDDLTLETLYKHIFNQVEAAAQQFDQRNGNCFYTNFFNSLLEA
ncbi:hypothetical protein E0485_03005 [Paenibacillus albiflavus]|uniref:Uncharacterized protein n=1 Tax=Paenibacillus albiflavus TaxID=2545760 RepID=A0A4R4EMG4_9BACL|nr:hypothetical protein [Paenibacillus albiflavus]TCZ81259.1 hypothetical protein E0485_03005 [Paenibacillus albiflavus]